MENSSLIKQAKSDIFKELYTIISFYIKKGAKPASLKKYYKNSKRFLDLLDDIKNKGVNLVKDENEYQKLVKDVLYEILDDFIAKDKDLEYKNKQDSKMKHIKEFYSFDSVNEYWSTSTTTGDFDINYGDEISDIVKNVEEYIKNNFDKITKFTFSSSNVFDIDFNRLADIRNFCLKKDNNGDLGLVFSLKGNVNFERVDLTDYEFKYLYNKMEMFRKQYRKQQQEEHKTKLSDLIDPAKINAEKYNL